MINWETLKSDLENSKDVKTVTMAELREIFGSTKLGRNVCHIIQTQLSGMGIGHIPKVLPKHQHELVRLYKKGTSIGDLIDLVVTPGEYNDAELRKLVESQGKQYQEILDKVKSLVCC